MSIKQTFSLNLIPESSPIIIHCDQYDTGTGRLVIKLYEGDVEYNPSGAVVIQGTKPDGKGFAYSATLSGNIVTADLTEQMTAVAGRVRTQIVVTETSGRTGTFVFILDVQRSALPADTDMSQSDIQFIEQAIEEAQDAAIDAEAWAVGERGGVPVGPSDPTYHNNSHYWAQQAAGVATLEDLDDVNITTPSNNQVLTYDANSGEWINANAQGGAASLDDLTDVDITTPSNGQILQYNSTSQEWENKNLPVPSTPDIDDLGDVNITSPSDGQFLKYDGNSGEWINGSGGGGGASDLDDLTDVSISSPTNGQVLKYNSTSQEWENANESGGGASDLDDLNDVTITTPTDGQVLVYDSVSGDWVNGTVSGGGGMNTNGSNATASVGMTNTKVFTIGDRTGKFATGEYAIELGEGGNAIGYGSYAEGIAKNYLDPSEHSITLPANTLAETLVSTFPLATYPYMAFGSSSAIYSSPTTWEVVVDNGLDEDETITVGTATARITQDGTDIKVYFTNTGAYSQKLYYGYILRQTKAEGNFSHAEGASTRAWGNYSHAEGIGSSAGGTASHAEGRNSTATGEYSHAESGYNNATGSYSHAEGYGSVAQGSASHSEGQDTHANGERSHAEGMFTYADGANQHVSGKYNIRDYDNDFAVIVGNGTGDNARANALTLDWSGNLEVSGDVECSTGQKLSQQSIYTASISKLVGDTSCTFTDANILPTSIIKPLSQNASGTPMSYSSINVTTGQAVLNFAALTEATDFLLEIININLI